MKNTYIFRHNKYFPVEENFPINQVLVKEDNHCIAVMPSKSKLD